MENKAVIKPMGEGARWLQWGNYHRAMFGWKSEAEVEMIAMWIGTFKRWGFTPDEMHKASESLLKRTTPAFKREDHINFLYQAVNDLRANARNAGASIEDYTRGVCSYCANSGLVTVPHLKSVDGLHWVDKKTCAVWCTCSDGRKYATVQTSDGRKLMGITEYNVRNPRWQDQLGNQRAIEYELDYLSSEARLMQRDSSKGKGFDGVTGLRSFDEIRDTIAIRFGLMGKAKGDDIES